MQMSKISEILQRVREGETTADDATSLEEYLDSLKELVAKLARQNEELTYAKSEA